MNKYRAKVAEVINALPQHAEFVKQYAPANAEVWNRGSPVSQQKGSALDRLRCVKYDRADFPANGAAP